MAGFAWTAPPDKVWPPGAAAYVTAIRRGVHGVMMRWQGEIESYMKTNAPWTDRTANARQGLYATVEPPTPAEVIDLLELIMAHSMFYGYYLENWNPVTNAPMMRPPQWQIIEPTLDYFAPKVWADIQRMLS